MGFTLLWHLHTLTAQIYTVTRARRRASWDWTKINLPLYVHKQTYGKPCTALRNHNTQEPQTVPSSSSSLRCCTYAVGGVGPLWEDMLPTCQEFSLKLVLRCVEGEPPLLSRHVIGVESHAAVALHLYLASSPGLRSSGGVPQRCSDGGTQNQMFDLRLFVNSSYVSSR